MAKAKPAGKLLIIGVILVGVFFGMKWWSSAPKDVKTGEKVSKGEVAIPDAPEASLSGNSQKLEFPSKKLSTVDAVKVVWNEMAWQSQTGLNYANGGASTTQGSLIEKTGLNIEIRRQDDCFQSVADMVKYIKEYAAGNTKDGFFMSFMGTGIPNYAQMVNSQIADLGAEYQVVGFISVGKSYGEDQVMGSVELYNDFKRNPQVLKGKVCRGVRLDGDLDLIIKLCGDNSIPINPNEKVYDREALNLSYAKDFLSAVVDYNQGIKETRKIAINGKTTGKDTTVGYDLVGTWTPGDVNVINGKGGVTFVSTRQYASIMPNITLACKKFLNNNRTAIENLIAAVSQAGDQVRSFDDVKKYATQLNSEIWNEQDAAYWYKYYNGVEHDKNTFLGGSMVFNLSDMAALFGLNGGQDVYKAVYNTFGKIQSKLYPQDLPTFPDYSKAIDKSYMMSVVANHPELLEGKALEIEYKERMTDVVASKSWNIEFATGSDDIKSESFQELNEILEEVTASEGLKIAIQGHTDNTGSDDINIPLSEARAKAVVDYLKKKGIKANRLEYQGFGSTKPIADNSTASGKAKNRRVQIILGQ